MEEPYFDSDLESYSVEQKEKNRFSFIIRNLPAREKHALEDLKITSVDAFCSYDFSKLLALRGYGETTVTRLQLLQKRICEEQLTGKHNEAHLLTPQSPIQNLKLSYKEYKALALLHVPTVGDFLNLDLSKITLPKGFGEKTHYLLTQSQKQIVLDHPTAISPLSPEKYSVLMFPLNPREKKILIKFHISSWQDLACFDFHQINNIPNIGIGTLNSLFSKQKEVRTKIVRAKIDSFSDFSYDGEYSVFLLDLTSHAKETLWNLGITRISELTKLNLNILKLSYTQIQEDYEELYQIQSEFSQLAHGTGNPLNNFLASEPLASGGLSDIADELLQQNTLLQQHTVHSLRDFLFFAIPEEYPALRHIQSEWQRRYTPIEFLCTVPSYFNILFYCQRNKTQNNVVKLCLNNFETAKDFLSVSLEDIMKLAPNDQTARAIRSAQYELLKSCLELPNRFDFSVHDEREQGWKREMNKESLSALPFFGGKHNRNFSETAFHETFLPNTPLNSIIPKPALPIVKQIDIHSLGKLLLTTCSHLLLLRYCSKSKIAEIQTRIQEFLLSTPDNFTQINSTPNNSTPNNFTQINSTQIKSAQTTIPSSIFPPPLLPLDKSAPETFLVSLLKRYIQSDRTIVIAVHRVCGKTLEQIAQIYGITRERIRQIETNYKNQSDLAAIHGLFAEVGQMLEKSLATLGGFAPIREITAQLAADNNWPEQDCTQSFVKFLLDRVIDKIVNHGKGYYSIKSYPCVKCGPLITQILSLTEEANQETVMRRKNFLATLLNTCCSECVDLPPRISEHFLDWKCLSDPLYFQLFSEDESFQLKGNSMQKRVVNVLKRSTHPLSVKEILDLIHYRLGEKRFTEKQVNTAATVLSIDQKDVFLWERGGVYAHRRHLPLDNPLLPAMEQKLKRLLKKVKSPYISLYTIFDEYQSECIAAGIPSVHALHTCLKARDMLGVAFMRSPCISVTKERHERRNIDILEDWVAQKKNVVSNRALKHYALEIGIHSQQYSSTYIHFTSLVRYEAGLIVHLNSLGWNQTKQDSMLRVAKNYWNHCISHGELYARVDQLLSKCKSKLPKLAHRIPWTSDLLFSLLLRSESVLTFGNTRLAYGFKNNISAPQTLSDIIVELLKRKFNGKTKLCEISSYLRDDLKIIKLQLTAKMLHSHPGLVVTKREIYLPKKKNLAKVKNAL
ncbi:MAG: hypothetical protein LBG58_16225 [Planctomycetaceae bacterium]|jgi:hypothetical protein|nr:hypothetical protein [Planctomycetaceae bacterium]